MKNTYERFCSNCSCTRTKWHIGDGKYKCQFCLKEEYQPNTAWKKFEPNDDIPEGKL